MPTLSTEFLSAAAQGGLAVKVAAIAGAGSGTPIHTAVAGTTNKDTIYIYAVNTSTASVKLTIEWGTTVAADGNIERIIDPADGFDLVIPGLPLQDTKVVTAFAATANVILLFGSVIRETA